MHQMLFLSADQATTAPPPDLRQALALRFRTSSMVMLAVVTVSAVGVLAGWWFDVALLKGVLPGLGSMNANTAISLLLTAATVGLSRSFIERPWRDPVLRAAMAIVALLAVVTLAQHLSGWNLRVDELIVSDAQSRGIQGRMSLTAAVALLLIQIGVWLAERPGGYDVAQGSVCGAALVATFDGVGYVFGLQRTVDPGTYGVMAIHTAAALLLLCLAFLFARPDEGVMDAVIGPGTGRPRRTAIAARGRRPATRDRLAVVVRRPLGGVHARIRDHARRHLEHRRPQSRDAGGQRPPQELRGKACGGRDEPDPDRGTFTASGDRGPDPHGDSRRGRHPEHEPDLGRRLGLHTRRHADALGVGERARRVSARPT